MINIAGLEKRFGPKVLFSDVTLQLNPRERYGLVGANGSGKSTFLRMLTGEEGGDAGHIVFGRQLRLGVLKQDQFLADDQPIVQVAMQGDQEVYEAITQLEAITHQSAPNAEQISHLNERIAHLDGYTLESRARETLLGLGLLGSQLDLPLGTLSGGFKLRVLLAQVLVGRPDALLLDEPTNHLDILSIRWLEQFLKTYAGCAVVISHDRRFLDEITTRILDVDYQTITDYPGNYSTFVERKELFQQQRTTEIERAERKIAEKQAFVERFRAKATKARQAQSRAKQIEKIEVKEVVRTSRRAPTFSFAPERPTGRDVLLVDALNKAYGDRRVLHQVSFTVRRGEKLAIIGKNGVGKSTLLKILSGHLSADAGTFGWGVHAKLGYFAQDHHDLLFDPEVTPLSFVWDKVPQEPTSFVRGHLGRMLFSGDDVEKKVTTLSGGEAARLIFASLAVERPNILLLDEPTNHLDLEAIDALAAALREYSGTLLFVSHDRWFVSQIADRIIELKEDGLHDFAGTYTEYLARDGSDHLDVDQVVLTAKQDKKQKAEAAP
ncbi:MAG TPA: ABC-F family ATP-binding cassette domain-containing protein, partial [Polyangiaceae bacterium]|nr:ABC-F family ATP-binding cassette domain-containing protein [Polyangiaceae bacterium]